MTNASEQKAKVDPEIRKYIDQLKKKLDNDPNNVSLRITYANDLAENGYNEEAIEQYRLLIVSFPDDAGLYYNLGVALEKINDMSNAIVAYRQSVKIDPYNVDGHYNLAYALDRTGEFELAIKEYKRTIELDPEDANAHFNLGCILSKCEDSKGAIKHLSIAANLNPNDEYAYFYLAYEMQKIGELEKAIEGYHKVLEINPDYSWANYNLGYIYLLQGKPDKAYHEFKTTYNNNRKDLKALKKLVEVGIECKKYDEILDLLENIIVAEPENAFAHFNIAEIYCVQKDFEDALHHYQKAINSPILKEFDIDLNKLKSRLKSIQTKTS